jgi:hypothetical protein
MERCLRMIIKANEEAAVDVRKATGYWPLRIIARLRLNGDEEASRPHISRFIRSTPAKRGNSPSGCCIPSCVAS